MKTLAFMLMFTIAALLGGGSLARANVNCTGTLTGVIEGNVVVPSGASCILGSTYTGANVRGNVQVGQNASLTVQARQYPSTITGNVQATQCAFALLEGAVTVEGNVQITQCKGESGFNGPGIKISGNFQCQSNAAGCDATIGVVGGNAQIQSNTGSASNVSLTEIQGNLQCLQNTPAPNAAYGANWVSGNLQAQCAANLGFTWSTSLLTCTQLAAQLVKIPYLAPPNGTVTSTLVAATKTNAAYCNVQLTYSAIGGPAYGYGGTTASPENQAIKIGIGLPLSEADGGTGGVQGAWNGRLQHLGGGGLVGSVGATTSATNAGYVGSSTDGGHSTASEGSAEGGGNFGVTGVYTPANAAVPTVPANTLDAGKLDDYILESLHEQVELGKLIPRIYYGQKWAYNYWNGCSTGGRQGLGLATYYGDEFDGFVTGAPAIYHDRFKLAEAWPYIVNQDDLVGAHLPPLTGALWTATAGVIITACQVNNPSGAIGYLDDPRACTASASLNICGASTAVAAPNCLTTEQAAAADKIWNGEHNAAGNRIWYALNKGVTGATGSDVSFTAVDGGSQQTASWDHASTSINVTRSPLTSNTLYESPAVAAAASPPGLAIETEALFGATPGVANGADGVAVNDLLDTVVPFYGVDELNLDLVKNHGAKIMMWQGTADQLIMPLGGLDYYRLVAVHYSGNGTADFAGLQSWIRYYHAPGAMHCATGTGAEPTNMFTQLVGWVEDNAAPDPVPAAGGSASTLPGQPTEMQSPPTPFTPPLCPWPTSAVYNGSGPGNVVSSFHCAGNLDANTHALCQMLRTPYGEETSYNLDYAEQGISPSQCPLPQ